eukprot:11320197-Alexandrium_andersonii.AAC.1
MDGMAGRSPLPPRESGPRSPPVSRRLSGARRGARAGVTPPGVAPPPTTPGWGVQCSEVLLASRASETLGGPLSLIHI